MKCHHRLWTTHDRTILGVACLHHLWIAHNVRQRQALHDRMGLGQHKWPDNVGLHMSSSPLGITQGLIMSGVVCPYRPEVAHMVLHAIITLGQHTQSDHVGCGMRPSPLGSIHGWMASAVAFYHRPWKTYTIRLRRAWHGFIIGRGIPLSRLDITYSGMTSGVTCHQYTLIAHAVGQRRFWHAGMSLG